MFWVMTAFTTPRRSSSATASWAGFGSWPGACRCAGGGSDQKRSGSVRNTERVATFIGLFSVQIPPRERKSGMPLSVETPAPVRTTACSAPASSSARSSGVWAIRARLLSCPPMRADGRTDDQLRPVGILPGFVETADGSALISVGRTRVICTASVEESVPAWMRGRGRGWVTAEYAMLPASTGDRKARDISRGKLDGRTTEIQRLIGRSLRAVVDMEALGERTVWLDCDVLQADGGTRCASICGAWVALRLALGTLVEGGSLERLPAHRLDRGRQRRHGQRAAAARPGLRRGLARRVGHERGDDRLGAARGGAGHRRGQHLLARRARRPARPGRGRRPRR